MHDEDSCGCHPPKLKGKLMNLDDLPKLNIDMKPYGKRRVDK